MGKYMKKGKITGDVAIMEIPQSNFNSNSSSLGVRTRARTLALQLQPQPTPGPSPDLSYLQLRSRRLQKPPFPPPPSNNTPTPIKINNNSQRSTSKVRVNSGSNSNDVAAADELEPSCGENTLDFDSRERSTRESTPCSLIRDPETIATPGSTTRPTGSAANRRVRNTQRTIPTNPEMEEFFAGFEHHHQELFIEKYNYDIKNDVPLPGRYEWVKVD